MGDAALRIARHRQQDRQFVHPARAPGPPVARSDTVPGAGSPMAFKSALQGPGRRLSRTKARKSFAMGDADAAMKGTEFRRSAVLLDEIRSAYKDIDEVMDNAR